MSAGWIAMRAGHSARAWRAARQNASVERRRRGRPACPVEQHESARGPGGRVVDAQVVLGEAVARATRAAEAATAASTTRGRRSRRRGGPALREHVFSPASIRARPSSGGTSLISASPADTTRCAKSHAESPLPRAAVVAGARSGGEARGDRPRGRPPAAPQPRAEARVLEQRGMAVEVRARPAARAVRRRSAHSARASATSSAKAGETSWMETWTAKRDAEGLARAQHGFVDGDDPGDVLLRRSVRAPPLPRARARSSTGSLASMRMIAAAHASASRLG